MIKKNMKDIEELLKPKYGFASPNYDPEAKRRAQSKGGKNGKGGGRPRKNKPRASDQDLERNE